MSDLFDGQFSYEDLPPEENPFYGLDGFDEFSETDPLEQIEREVLDSLGIESFEDIVFDISDSEVNDLRGNRFEDLREAILYLFDSGILRFSGVVLDGDEVMIEVDSDSGGRNSS
jgi:hypothetical protein